MKITNSIIENHGLKLEEYENIKEILKRDPNLLEPNISAMWNEIVLTNPPELHLKNSTH